MKKATPVKRNFFVLGIFFIVAASILYYFFAYMPQRETELNQRGVRLMNQMASNINAQEKHLDKSIEVYFNNKYGITKGEKVDKLLDEKILLGDPIKNNFLYYKSPADLLEKKIRDTKERIQELEKKADIKQVEEREDLVKLLQKDLDSLILNTGVSATEIQNIGKLELEYKKEKNSLKTSKDEIARIENEIKKLRESLSEAWSGDKLGKKADDILNNLKRTDFFSEVFITNNLNKVLNSNQLGLIKFNIDTSFFQASASGEYLNSNRTQQDFGVNIIPQQISNLDYLVFSKTLIFQGYPFTLYGVIENSQFTNEKRSVSLWVVVVAILLLSFLTLLLPIIKPFVLSASERLEGSDILWVVSSLVLGLSIIVIITISGGVLKSEEEEDIELRLKTYSSQIKDGLADEINYNWSLLESFKTFVKKDNKADVSKFALKNPYIEKKGEIGFLRLDRKGKLAGKLSKHYIFKKNSGTTNLSEEPTSLKNRKYFNIYEIGKPFVRTMDSTYLKCEENSSEYYIESIFSYRNGVNETAMSRVFKDDEDDYVWALYYPFKFLNKLKLGPGYSYSVIDNSGNVLYDSNPIIALNENIYDELEDSRELRSLVNNKKPENFEAQISIADYSCYFDEIPNTEFYLITKFEQKRKRLLLSTTVAIVLEFTFALLFYLFFLHLLLAGFNRLLSKGKRFTYDFMNPLKVDEKVFKRLLALNLTAIGVLIIVFWNTELNLLKNVLVYFGIITTLILVAFSYINASKNIKSNPASRMFELTLLLLSLGWMIIGIFKLNAGFVIFIPQFIVILVFVILKIFYSTDFENVKSAFRKYLPLDKIKETLTKLNQPFYTNKFPPNGAYYLHALSFIFLFSIIPVFLFLKPVYNYQKVSRAVINKQLEAKKGTTVFSNLKETSVNATKTQSLKRDKKDIFTANSEFIEKIAFNSSSDLDWSHAAYLNGVEIDPALGGTYVLTEGSKKTKFTIKPYSLPWPGENINWLFFIILMLFVFGGLYSLIVNLCEKFFYVTLTRELRSYEPEHISTAHIASKGSKFLVGFPFTGRNKQANMLLQNSSTKKALHIDLIANLNELLDKLTKEKNNHFERDIVFNNLDYRISDVAYNLEKLKILELVFSKIGEVKNSTGYSSHMVIISSLDIYQIIEIYRQKKRELPKGSTKEAQELDNAMKRWKSILFGFSKHIVALQENDMTQKLSNPQRAHLKNYEFGIRCLQKELKFGSQLYRLYDELDEYIWEFSLTNDDLSDNEIKDKVVYAVLDLAENYYFALWNACSLEEKFILFDFAEDQLMNPKNKRAIFNLYKRGLLVLEDQQIRIFNRSFAVFILESISEEETLKMEKEAKKKGSFNRYKYMVILLVLILIIFISFAEEQMFTQITSILSLGAVLIPSIIKIATSFSFKNPIPIKSQ